MPRTVYDVIENNDKHFAKDIIGRPKGRDRHERTDIFTTVCSAGSYFVKV